MSQRDAKGVEQTTPRINDRTEEREPTDLKYRLKAAAFLAIVGGLGLGTGFGGALAAAKKQDPASFDKGLTPEISKKVCGICTLPMGAFRVLI